MPFIGEPIQVAMQHCNVPPPTIAALNPEAGVPAELDAFIQRMLAKDRDARPQTMEDIEAFLHDFLPAHNVGARPITGPIPMAGAGLNDSAPNHFGPDSSLLTASASGSPAVSNPQQKTVIAGSTPASGLPRVDTRTNLDNQRPQASTVEIHLDAESPRPAPHHSKGLIPLLGGVAALVGLLAFVFSGGEDPPAPTVPVAAPPTKVVEPVKPPEVVKPPVPPPVEAKVEPVPSDTTGAPPEPVPSDSAGDAKADDPKVKKPPVKTGEKTGDKTGDKPADPMAKLRRAAEACRKKHKAAKGPKITVDYATGSDGSVTRAVPSQQDALGKCLADAVKATKFAPQLKLGLKIDL
jgi:serine/threonine-protein kinase